MSGAVLVGFTVFTIGAVIGSTLERTFQTLNMEILKAKVAAANKQAGKLSKIIHRQRIKIREMSKQIPQVDSKTKYEQYKARVAAAKNVSH